MVKRQLFTRKKNPITVQSGITAAKFILILFFSDYVEEIFQTFLNASKDELVNAAAKLSEKTPAPMNTMLEKQSRDEAMKKKEERSQMVVKDVPPTTPGTSS